MLEGLWRRMDEACIRAFGRDLLFLPKAGGSFAFRGIFQRTAEPEEASPGVYAVVFARLEDLPGAPSRGDELSVDGARYVVYDIEADPAGAAVLKLRKA